MSGISQQFELIKMSNKNYVFKHFLNIDNVPDAWMFTGNSFHSRGAAVLNAESPIDTLLCYVLVQCRCIVLAYATTAGCVTVYPIEYM